jgi:hypothetical protein
LIGAVEDGTGAKVTWGGKLSDDEVGFRIWFRHDFFFRLSHPKVIQIYGTNDPAIGNDPESPNSAWIKLNPEPFVSIRPSGVTVSADEIPVDNGSVDYDYALAGEEYIFPSDAPVVQWFRFESLEAWTSNVNLQLMEIRFWGYVK